MNNITHARVDYRLIHGQVITKWLRVSNAKKIVIIDDVLKKDAFLAKIFKMAAPTGIEVKIIGVEESMKVFEENNEKVLLLFKTIDSVKRSIDAGLSLESLQIGGLENKAGRKMVHNQISLDKDEYYQLKEIEEKGTRVYFQTIPEEKESNLENIGRKMGIK